MCLELSKKAKEILSALCASQGVDLTYSECKEALLFLSQEIEEDFEEDITLELPCFSYRIIEEDAIWGIYVDTIKEMVKECYDINLENMPSFVSWSVDWEDTANNALQDGYGHTFSGYDGSELLASGYYIFRTN